jgi:hypothetical protein
MSVVEGRVFDPRTLPELQTKPERFPIYGGYGSGQLALAGGHLSTGDY